MMILEERVLFAGKFEDARDFLYVDTIARAADTVKGIAEFNLNSDPFLTSDAAILSIEDGKLQLYFGDVKINFVLNGSSDKWNSMKRTGKYNLSAKEKGQIYSAAEKGKMLKIEVSEQNFPGILAIYRFFEIYNTDAGKQAGDLNEDQNKLSEKILGRIRGTIEPFSAIKIHSFSYDHMKHYIREGSACLQMCSVSKGGQELEVFLGQEYFSLVDYNMNARPIPKELIKHKLVLIDDGK
ncbi:MAG: hypothetical protein Q8O89_08270 [Nanoarchaeota archaeon]|nr:hypothetical protein [Nanoarchaeota archaeon]